MKKLSLLCCFCFTIICAFAQQPSFISDSLDSYIRNGIKQWNIPGLSIVIVKEGKVVLMKGYGVRDLKTNAPVDENTLFMIASNTKLFTATSLAQLDYDKKLSLDDKITKYFPAYRVFDATTTQLVTIRDMLSHHLGTKTFQGDFTFWNSLLTPSAIMDKMKLLKPTANFRQSFGYCNSCFLTAGQVMEKVTGKPWDAYVHDSITQPLGMVNTHTLGAGMKDFPNASKPYSSGFSGQVKELAYDNVDNLAPAGSMVSSVKDLSHWIMMLLDSGKYEGRQILPWAVLRRTRQMQTIISSNKSYNLPQHYYGYGLGNFQGDYNGMQVYEHTGGADGFVSNVCIVPEARLGISILTNNDTQDFFEALRYQILDAYLGVKYVNRSEQFYKFFKPDLDESVKKVKDMQARVKGTKAPMELSAYVGNYNNELYGQINITQNKKDLLVHLTQTRDLTATLQYMDNDEWLLTYSNPAFGIFLLKFVTANGKVTSMDVKVNDFLEYDPYTFVKE